MELFQDLPPAVLLLDVISPVVTVSLLDISCSHIMAARAVLIPTRRSFFYRLLLPVVTSPNAAAIKPQGAAACYCVFLWILAFRIYIVAAGGCSSGEPSASAEHLFCDLNPLLRFGGCCRLYCNLSIGVAC